MTIKIKYLVYALTLFLVILGCDEETSPEPINEELREFLQGSAWISESSGFSEYQNEKSNFYEKIEVAFDQSNLRINDTLFYKQITNVDTTVSWYHYSATINIDKYDIYKPNVEGNACFSGFEDPVNRGNLVLNRENYELEYARSSDTTVFITDNIIFEKLGNHIVTDQTGDTLSLENCFNTVPKMVRVQ